MKRKKKFLCFKKGQQLTLKDVKLQQEKTKAPPAFTEGTLIAAMENIHNAVEDPKDKKLLKDGDGIGTPQHVQPSLPNSSERDTLKPRANKFMQQL